MKSLRERTKMQQAYLDGAEIEFKSNITESEYSAVSSDCAFAHWVGGDYRIKPKPKPMERWANIYDNQEDAEDYLYLSEEDAKEDLCADGRTVHFIEEI